MGSVLYGGGGGPIVLDVLSQSGAVGHANQVLLHLSAGLGDVAVGIVIIVASTLYFEAKPAKRALGQWEQLLLIVPPGEKI